MIGENIPILFNEGPALVVREACMVVFSSELEADSLAVDEGEYVTFASEGCEDLIPTVGDREGTTEGFPDNTAVGRGDGMMDIDGPNVGDRVGTTEGFDDIPARF